MQFSIYNTSVDWKKKKKQAPNILKTCLSAILDGLSPIGTSIPPQSDVEITFGEKNKLFISTYPSGRAPIDLPELQLLTPCGYHTLYVGFATGFSGNSWWLLPSSFYAVLCLENVNAAHWKQMLLPQQVKGALNLIQHLFLRIFMPQIKTTLLPSIIPGNLKSTGDCNSNH